eukprot:g26281.t1
MSLISALPTTFCAFHVYYTVRCAICPIFEPFPTLAFAPAFIIHLCVLYPILPCKSIAAFCMSGILFHISHSVFLNSSFQPFHGFLLLLPKKQLIKKCQIHQI